MLRVLRDCCLAHPGSTREGDKSRRAFLLLPRIPCHLPLWLWDQVNYQNIRAVCKRTCWHTQISGHLSCSTSNFWISYNLLCLLYLWAQLQGEVARGHTMSWIESHILRLENGRWKLEDLMNKKSQLCRAWRKTKEVVKVIPTPTSASPDIGHVSRCRALEETQHLYQQSVLTDSMPRAHSIHFVNSLQGKADPIKKGSKIPHFRITESSL